MMMVTMTTTMTMMILTADVLSILKKGERKNTRPQALDYL